MNKTNLKRYAPQARKDFIEAVTARAHLLGLMEVGGQPHAEPSQINGDVTVIAGRAWPASVEGKRERLLQRMKRDGYAATLDAVAYTWFNRFAALRYMELHDYLGHGRRVLSNPDGGLPEILSHALELAEVGDLPGLQAEQVRKLKLDNQDSELFRRVLVAQCNALHSAMPFLFERIDDDSELLLPDNLLRSDSVIAKLVAEIPDEDWAEVEIIGWLYQFYISEKKDQVIGKVVKSEDIPAATQLFTPNWIVQYLVQNSVGRLWLMANPQSTLAKEWPYYITPAEQTPEVQAQLDALIQTRVREDGDTLNPESITVLDPACGSGHILVVAYDVLKAIYLERGYQPRAISRLILEKNLYGLDIDDRAAQMAGFALLMKARADDRRLFTATDDAGNLQPPKVNVLSLQESKGLDIDELATHLAPFKVQRATIAALLETFEHAKTFGSLIQIPYALKTYLAVLPEVLTLARQSGDMYASAASDDLLPLVQQAQALAMQFDAVVANPPYLNSGAMYGLLKKFAIDNFPEGKSDLFACFIERSYEMAKNAGSVAVVAPYVWMFISSYEKFRKKLIRETNVATLIQLEYNAFEPACIPVATFTLQRGSVRDFVGSYIDLSEFKGHQNQSPKTLEAIGNPERSWNYRAVSSNFLQLPGAEIAFNLRSAFFIASASAKTVGELADVREGINTGDNDRFLRCWFEVPLHHAKLDAQSIEDASKAGARWFPCNKGGGMRRWFGNNDFVVNWENDGHDIRNLRDSDGKLLSRPQNTQYFFQEGVTWSGIGSSGFGARYFPVGFAFNSAGRCLFSPSHQTFLIALLNSVVAGDYLSVMAPTLSFTVGNIAGVPALLPHTNEKTSQVEACAKRLIQIGVSDWNAYERSWEFPTHPILAVTTESKNSIEANYKQWITQNRAAIEETQRLEIENNRYFIEAYNLNDELSPDIPVDQITITVNPAYRYGIKVSEDEQWKRFRHDTIAEFISYAIGCMMGRYSLDEPGLIYAHAGNVGFEPGRYASFPADADGIVPITDELWFADDAPSRIREFLRAVWGPDTLEENMAWLAESLGTKASETPDETVRRYIADKFFKDHLQTYKKRPIYWLFSSGKQGAFQALVYLHRYHEGTLARMRAEYVVPLTGKILSRIEMLEKDAAVASSTSARNKLNKEVEKLKKKHIELLAYDEKLRHYADMRITLDLDDGVKVNYGKFGDLLDSVKTVTGGASDD